MAFEDFNPGELNKRIQIVQIACEGVQTDSFGFADDGGEEVQTVVCQAWAKITDETGLKAIENGSEFATARRRFLIRDPKKEITTDMMIKYKGDLYAIKRPPSTFGDAGRFMEIWTEKTRRESWRR